MGLNPKTHPAKAPKKFPNRFFKESAWICRGRDVKMSGKRRLTMSREFNVVIELDEDGYFVASVPALRGCHTQAKSLDVLMKRIKEAISLCLEVDDAPVSNQFIGVQRVAVMV